MAITSTAPKSSTIAKAVRKIFKLVGTLFPSTFNTARAKAISVAMGIPQPFRVSGFWLRTKYRITGRAMPPKAPNSGNITFLVEFNSPIKNSRFISSPIKKKKIDINPSFTQSIKGFTSSKLSVTMPISYCQKD